MRKHVVVVYVVTYLFVDYALLCNSYKNGNLFIIKINIHIIVFKF